MSDNVNTNPNTSWFRSFGRSSTSTAKQQQQHTHAHLPAPTTAASTSAAGTASQRPHPLSLQLRHEHRNTFHRVPTSTSISAQATHSPTTESPPNHQQQQPHGHNHHRHRKSAGATLRTVSSFLSLKSGSKSGHASPAELEPEPEPEPEPTARGEQKQKPGPGLGLGPRSWPGSGAEFRPESIRTSAGLAMLPLTEVDGDDDGYDGRGWLGGKGEGGGRGGGAGGGGEGTAWYNPSLMQMAETLGAVMARKGAGEVLDVAYNSCVLSLIEGFYRLTRKLRDTEEQLGELKDLRERELEQFRGMTEEWLETGEKYKAEIKRLELALAKESKDGVASVALARHGSLVDRAGSKRFQARLQEMNNSSKQDTGQQRAPQPAEEAANLAEATSSYRTLGVIPRVLDPDNDVSLSRILEQREFEEQVRRHQQRRQGRVRAAPVLVRPGGAAESRAAVMQVLMAEQPSTPAVSQNPSTGMERPNAYGDHPAQPDDSRPAYLPCPFVSTDEESSSSSSSSSTEPSSGRFALRFPGKQSGKQKDKSKKIKKKNDAKSSEGDGGGGRRRKDKRKLPRLRIKGANRSLQEPSQGGPPLGETQRRRCYSFEKGDERLFVTSPTLVPGSFTQLRPPLGADGSLSQRGEGEGEGTLARTSDALVRDTDGELVAATRSANIGAGLIRHSASTNTVRWVGEESADGGSTETGKGKEREEIEGTSPVKT